MLKLKKNSTVLEQLKEKHEECIENLLNDSSDLQIRTEADFVLEEEVKSNELLRHLIPEQAQTVGETAHLVQHDALDIQKQEDDKTN